MKLAALGGASIFTDSIYKKTARLIPYVILPEKTSAVAWNTLATTCRECPAGCGMHVRHRDGRITKAEGNPLHPVNRGGLCARGQSALQGIYDPDRIKTVLYRSRRRDSFKPGNWDQAFAFIGGRLKGTSGRVAILSKLETGSLYDLMTRFLENFGSDRLILYEAFNYEPLRKAHALLFGWPVVPYYRLDDCRYILSFSADFLETWISNVQFAYEFSQTRVPETGPISRFTYIGPRLSMTAANADDFHQVQPGMEADAALSILRIMAEEGMVSYGREIIYPLIKNVDINRTSQFLGIDRMREIARRFANSSSSVVLAGPVGAKGKQAERLALAATLINYATGRYGTTVDISRPHALSGTAFESEVLELLGSLTSDDTLIILNTNPVYTRAGAAELLNRAGLVVYCGTMLNETALAADWVLPANDDLESWGDYEPYKGIYSLMQPTMRPLSDSRETGNILLGLAASAGKPVGRLKSGPAITSMRQWVRERWDSADRKGWRKAAEPRETTEYDEWEEALRRGGNWPESIKAGDAPKIKSALQPDILTSHDPRESLSQGEAWLWLWPSIMLFDGRTANRGWIQEAPEPVSFNAWSCWIDIHPDTAKKFMITDEDVVELAAFGRALEAPARITPEVPPDTAALILGQGHTALGKLAAGLGSNGFLLMNGSEDNGFFGRVSIKKKGSMELIALAMGSRDQHGRELLRWKKFEEYIKKEIEEVWLPLPSGYSIKKDVYKSHKHVGHRWAMSIDLQRCIGCGACAVACYAENNLAVVGKKEVARGRQMAWLRVVPYQYDEDPLRVAWLPVPCQHCNDAPCEPVCPVYASVNNEEGLNAQIYNRCIGTRYCSNNCPYKVRRFNWLNYDWPPPLDMQLNPEVTVRSRGVMEKCTFCVQRIRNAEYEAIRENRTLRDGEIQPACVQSCPARVFTFGDLLDPDSAVSRVARDAPRRYQLLKELNTKPAVFYLYRIKE